MRVLFIGGTGDISTSASKLALERGIELFLLNRGKTQADLPGATWLQADIHDPEQVRQAIKGLHFDSVVNWVAYVPEDVERDIELFRGLTHQYVFISSASAYQKPPVSPVITESTPLHNPFWRYSRNKAVCEARLMAAYDAEVFPVTIVRPSHTYAKRIPAIMGGPYAMAERLLNGWPVLVHGDGTSLWTLTHSEDFAIGFVGLLGHPQSIGHAIHITSDELLTWNQIHETVAQALNVEPHIVHIPSDFIARVNPEVGPGLLGDKAHSVTFDNTKIKRLVPEYKAVIPFHQGIRKVLAWFDEDAQRKVVDPAAHEAVDAILRAYGAATR
ncbi:MAG TPA: SDR family oxidoreductase [Candidatus Limnocylindrales bacterium]|nr:SDR family oxidoreductase [Candidatus Limnocylindrales bacterium]